MPAVNPSLSATIEKELALCGLFLFNSPEGERTLDLIPLSAAIKKNGVHFFTCPKKRIKERAPRLRLKMGATLLLHPVFRLAAASS